MTNYLKDLSLQYKRLGEQLKYVPLRRLKKAKGSTEDELKIATLEKEVERLNIHLRGKEEECRSVTMQWRNETCETIKLKMRLKEEHDKNVESEEKKRAFNKTIQELEQMFIEQRKSFIATKEGYEYKIYRLNLDLAILDTKQRHE